MNYQEIKNHVQNILNKKETKPIILVGSGRNGKSNLIHELVNEGYDIISISKWSWDRLIGMRGFFSDEINTPESLFKSGYILELGILAGIDNLNRYTVIDMNHLHF